MKISRRGLIGAGLAAGLPAVADTPAKVAIGFPVSDDFVPAMVAKDLGLFAQQGVDATITIISLISNIPAAILSGSLQIGATTGPTLLQARENGLDLVAVAGMSHLTPDHQLVSLVIGKNSGITKPADLIGKKIAVPGLNSLLDLLLRRWLVQNKIDPARVTLIEASFPAMADMLRTGQVDAAIIKEPSRSSAISSGAGVRFVDYPGQVRPDILNTFWIAERRWAEANPAAVHGFRAGLDAGIAAYEKDPKGGRQIEQRYFKAREGMMPFFSTRMTPDDLAFMQELTHQFGLVDSKLDPKSMILN
jgi:NitT/TauT family transport system substrate-binding protein